MEGRQAVENVAYLLSRQYTGNVLGNNGNEGEKWIKQEGNEAYH